MRHIVSESVYNEFLDSPPAPESAYRGLLPPTEGELVTLENLGPPFERGLGVRNSLRRLESERGGVCGEGTRLRLSGALSGDGALCAGGGDDSGRVAE